MVRRATLDRGQPSDKHAVATDHSAAAEADSGYTRADNAADQARRYPPRWRGAGGRWLVWVFRVVVWTVLLVIGFRGVASIMNGTGSGGAGRPASATTAGSAGSRFPVKLAEAYALDFGQAYLNFSPATSAQRARELAPFIPRGSDPQFGWNGAGTQRLQSEQVAAISVKDGQHAVVTLLALVSKAAGSDLMRLDVPVYAARGRLVIPAAPSWLAGPARARQPQSSAAGGKATDPAAQAALSKQLPAFFRAYARGDQTTLGRFVAPGAAVSGLGGAVTFGSVAWINVPTGGPTRQVIVGVNWRLPEASGRLLMSYQLTVVRQAGSWYVRSIGPALQGRPSQGLP